NVETVSTAASGKLRSVADKKKSWVNLLPAFPSFERSVTTLEFSFNRAEVSCELSWSFLPPGPPPKKNAPPPPPRLVWVDAEGVGEGVAVALVFVAPTTRV